MAYCDGEQCSLSEGLVKELGAIGHKNVKVLLNNRTRWVESELPVKKGDGGPLDSRKEGLWVYYRLDDGTSGPYAAAILGNLKHWLEETPEIIEITESLPDIRSANSCRT